MSPVSTEVRRYMRGFPRTRGDEPNIGLIAKKIMAFSPHTRG